MLRAGCGAARTVPGLSAALPSTNLRQASFRSGSRILATAPSTACTSRVAWLSRGKSSRVATRSWSRAADACCNSSVAASASSLALRAGGLAGEAGGWLSAPAVSRLNQDFISWPACARGSALG